MLCRAWRSHSHSTSALLTPAIPHPRHPIASTEDDPTDTSSSDPTCLKPVAVLAALYLERASRASHQQASRGTRTSASLVFNLCARSCERDGLSLVIRTHPTARRYGYQAIDRYLPSEPRLAVGSSGCRAARRAPPHRTPHSQYICPPNKHSIVQLPPTEKCTCEKEPTRADVVMAPTARSNSLVVAVVLVLVSWRGDRGDRGLFDGPTMPYDSLIRIHNECLHEGVRHLSSPHSEPTNRRLADRPRFDSADHSTRYDVVWLAATIRHVHGGLHPSNPSPSCYRRQNSTRLDSLAGYGWDAMHGVMVLWWHGRMVPRRCPYTHAPRIAHGDSPWWRMCTAGLTRVPEWGGRCGRRCGRRWWRLGECPVRVWFR